MDTNRIKKFAIEARNILKQGVAAKLLTLGFDKKGDVAEQMRPKLVQGGAVWNRHTETEGFYHRWMSLYNRIRQKGINEVYEEAAYTWFNRLIAIRILQKNNLTEPILDFADEARTPRIVDEARSGRIFQMPEEVRTHLMTLLADDTKTSEQFALLITAWCHQNPIIEQCFGDMADYTELLLPNNILAEGGFLDMLNHTEFITDDNFQSPELIGWLYQFYISERKDEVFAKKGKYEADEIPAATQIFTPNWIVKYMVENTVGRIYLDNNLYAYEFKDKWKYLVEGEPTPEESKYRYKELTDLKVADLACGSGHILNECFDILYDLYVAEGYSRGETIENIFRYNLTGIDLDKRAKQLATFALLLKASQKDRSYADAHVLPFILTMPKQWDEEKNGSIKAAITNFFRGCETPSMIRELEAAFELMKDADSLGSIMKFDISDTTRFALKQAVEYWGKESFVPETVSEMMPAMQLILALTEKYSAVVMNPPYMGSGNMNEVLKKYVDTNYSLTANDLGVVFMDLAYNRISDRSVFAMINQSPWANKNSYNDYRLWLKDNVSILTYLDLGSGTFTELSGEVVQSLCFVIKKSTDTETGCFYNLSTGSDTKQKENLFVSSKINPYHFSLKSISQIPDCKICYWICNQDIQSFKNGTPLNKLYPIKKGLATGNDSYFLRLWFEVANKTIDYKCNDLESANNKWITICKGGGYRKWYGNIEYIINWLDNGIELKSFRDDKGKLLSRSQNLSFMLKEAISYNIISSRTKGFVGRFLPSHMMMTDVAPNVYSTNIPHLLPLLNSVVGKHFCQILCPSFKYETGYVGQIPILEYKSDFIESACKQNVRISQTDWDSHEISWNFQENELVGLNEDRYIDIINEIYADSGLNADLPTPQLGNLQWRYELYKQKWKYMFQQLHTNEEELNRLFIDIYGLQDELTPDVPLEEITILQQGEIKIENGNLIFQADVVMKQLISYAIGCWMGRYRLDKPGLYIAHPNVKEEEIVTYTYGNETFTIDDDGIIALLPYECPFDDNLQNRIADFTRIAFGADSSAENLNFIEQCLGTPIEKYLDKDYWKDHKRMYKNRPIYWLWSSKKGAFRCISYMHRMDAYTAERIRSKYLLPYIEYLKNKITELESRAAQLSVVDSRKLDTLRKALDECSEYHERLQVEAEKAIAFDLDDGVVVNYAKFGDVLAKIK